MPDLAFKWHLGSELWAERCAMERANFICQRCHKEPATEVHHLVHVGVASDLLPVCSACHRSIHRRKVAHDNEPPLPFPIADED